MVTSAETNLILGMTALTLAAGVADEVNKRHYGTEAKKDQEARRRQSPFGFGVLMPTEHNRSLQEYRNLRKPSSNIEKIMSSLNKKNKIVGICLDMRGNLCACTIPAGGGGMRRTPTFADGIPVVTGGLLDRKSVSWAYGGAWMDEKYASVLRLSGDTNITLHIVLRDGTKDSRTALASRQRLAYEPCLDAMLAYFPSVDLNNLIPGTLLYFSVDPLYFNGNKSLAIRGPM